MKVFNGTAQWRKYGTWGGRGTGTKWSGYFGPSYHVQAGRSEYKINSRRFFSKRTGGYTIVYSVFVTSDGQTSEIGSSPKLADAMSLASGHFKKLTLAACGSN